MTLDVATFSQIMKLLTQLSTNYTNIFTDYYNVFYNPEPMDITLQFYDQDGNLEEITIPNRAKDRAYILNGNGDPNGNISGNRGSIYQDLANGEVYINIDGSINGWAKLFSEAALSKIFIQGSGSPEDVVSAEKGVLYIDVQNAALYIKSTETGDTGWVLVSASTSVLARVSLDNLNEEGEAHFANPSLSNLDSTGVALIDSKEDKANKITEITSTSGIDQYPTARAVYSFVGSTAGSLANRELSNLKVEGEEHFVGMTQIRDGIFKAPNGFPSVNGNNFVVPSDTIIYCANGLNDDNAVVNEKITTTSLTSLMTWSSADDGVLLYSATSNELIYHSIYSYYRQVEEPTGSTSMLWYNPSTNFYKVSSDSGNTWSTIKAAEIGRFTTDDSGNISSFSPYHPIVVATEDDIRTLDELKLGKTDLQPIQCVLRTVVNDTSWYRVWSNGWIEQGGVTPSIPTDGSLRLTFLQPFSNANYTVQLTVRHGAGITGGNGMLSFYPYDNSSITIFNGQDTAYSAAWYACGY